MSQSRETDGERTLVLVYRPETNEYLFRQSVLRVLEGPDEGRTYALARERTTLGKHPNNDVKLGDPFISRHHAEIRQGPEGAVIEDLKSSNGTVVDGQPVRRMKLEHGAVVSMGRTRLRYETHHAAIPGPGRERAAAEDPAAVIGRFAVETVHEVKNLLHGIRANAEYLAQQQGANLPAVNILRGTEGIYQCVNKVLAYSRSDRIEQAPCDLAEILNNTIMFWAPALEERHIALERAYGKDLRVSADGRQLQELFSNLIENAILSMEAGGSLTVEVQPGEDSDLRIRIRDTGPGIPVEMHRKVFDAFFTTRPTGKGTGLGLAICRRIAVAHGGGIHVEKSSSKGTTFLVRLPGLTSSPVGYLG